MSEARQEQASTVAKAMIETLMNLHALACMYRASGDTSYHEGAANWLPYLRSLMRSLEDEFKTSHPKDTPHE